MRDAEAVEATVCKAVLTGFESRLSLQSEGAKRRQRFLVPKTSAPEGPGWGFDSSALRHHIKVLAFRESLHLPYVGYPLDSADHNL